jgi:tetratricopeptide (TPR) repeat protein
MRRFRSTILPICLLILAVLQLNAQDLLFKRDSLIQLLKSTYSQISAEKIRIVSELMSRQLPGDSVFDSLKNSIIEESESSRNRVLTCMTYSEVAQSYLSYYNQQEYAAKGKAYADKCLEIATESGLNEYKVAAYFNYARYYLNTSQNQKALDYNNQAISLASAIGSDSLLSLAYGSIANTWDALSNKLSEFQALLNERDFAEKSLAARRDQTKQRLQYMVSDSYNSLGQFYENNSEYEKAKDYYTTCIQQGRQWGDPEPVYNGLISMGRVYFQQKSESLGILYYNKALQFVDSLAIPQMKLRIYLDLLNYYFNSNNPVRGFNYLNSHSEIMDFVKNIGIAYQMNKLYAELQRNKKNYDSALYFLRIAAPFEYAQKTNYSEKFNFSMQLSDIFKEMGRMEDEKKSLLLAKKFADSSEDLNLLKEVSLKLDSLFQRLGDFKNAQTYLQQYDIYRDSLETLGRQKDLLNIEIENATKRTEQQKIMEAEAKRLRNNVEYLGITAALATVFIILVILGVFRISPAVIKGLGFFAFIFLFEFIVLLLDTQIHELTQGEPWKVLGVKVVIIALLLPLHHWLEEKMLHYLTFKAPKIKPKIFERK